MSTQGVSIAPLKGRGDIELHRDIAGLFKFRQHALLSVAQCGIY